MKEDITNLYYMTIIFIFQVKSCTGYFLASPYQFLYHVTPVIIFEVKTCTS